MLFVFTRVGTLVFWGRNLKWKVHVQTKTELLWVGVGQVWGPTGAALSTSPKSKAEGHGST